MGVDVGTWRARIGCFSTHGHRARFIAPAIVVGGRLRIALRLLILASVLLLVSGNVERNPGPVHGRGTGRGQIQSTLNYDTFSSLGRRQTRSSMRQNSPTLEERNRHFDFPEQDRRQSQHGEEGLGAFEEILARLDSLGQQQQQLGSKFDRIERKLDEEVKELRIENERLSMEVEDLRRQHDRLESHTRRNNLLFHGLPSGDKTWEESEAKVRDFLVKTLTYGSETEVNNIEIERAHRLPGAREPRPLIVKFLKYKDKDSILKEARAKLKGSEFYITEDYVKSVRDTRKNLQPFLQDAKSRSQKASLRYDKLLIEGVLFEYDYERKDIRPARRGGRTMGMGRPAMDVR